MSDYPGYYKHINCKSSKKRAKDYKFQPAKHQEIVTEYFLNSPYKGLLLYHKLGSGKSCTSIMVADAMLKNNKVEMAEQPEDDGISNTAPTTPVIPMGFDHFMEASGSSEDEDDDLFEEALAAVLEAKKASASLLQRRLKVGYARAARLLDLMQAGDYIGPGDGAKPREVLERIGTNENGENVI